jgi:hypothetical protein
MKIKTFASSKKVPPDYSGKCKIFHESSTCYFLNGKLHREDGPAKEYSNGTKIWYINGIFHREDGPACEYENGNKQWWYKDKNYGINNDFTNKTWIEKVEELKREEELKIFI